MGNGENHDTGRKYKSAGIYPYLPQLEKAKLQRPMLKDLEDIFWKRSRTKLIMLQWTRGKGRGLNGEEKKSSLI
jgi:hypothetical protein